MAVNRDLLDELEADHDLPPGILHATMTQESNGDANATSGKGAKGYFQFMPDTAQAYGVNDPTDFKQSATGAAKYFADLSKRYGGDTRLMLAAYNAGPTAVTNAGGKVPAYPETQKYVGDVMNRMSMNNPPDSLDSPPDSLDAPQSGPWGGEANSRSVQPAQRSNDEISKATSIKWPLMGSVGGGVLGAGGGEILGGPPGAAMGGMAGVGLGAFFGNLKAISDAQASGSLPQDLPVDTKLSYALHGANKDLVMQALTMGGMKALPAVLAMFPQGERSAVEAFFRSRGVQGPRPQVGPMAEWTPETYRQASKDMQGAIQGAIDDVTSDLGAQAGSPTAIGRTFKAGLGDAYDSLGENFSNLFAAVKRGTVAGDQDMLWGTPAATDFKGWVDKTIQTMKNQKTWNPNSSVGQFMQEVSDNFQRSGNRLTVADMIDMKRGVDKLTTFAKQGQEDALAGFDDAIKRQFRAGIDNTIEDTLSHYPTAQRAYMLANQQYSQGISDLTGGMIDTMIKRDPMSVTDYVAQNASPTMVNTFDNALQRMRRLGDLSQDEVNTAWRSAQQNWILRNMKDPEDAAATWKAITGPGANPAQAETFNAMFHNNPVARKAMLDAGEAANALNAFKADIPAGTRVGPMGYTLAMSGAGAGAHLAGAGGPVVSTAAAVGVGSLIKLYTGALPKALARAAMNDDTAMMNQIRAISRWTNNASDAWASSGIPISALPQGISARVNAVDQYSQGNEKYGPIPKDL